MVRSFYVFGQLKIFDFNICVWKREKEKASCKIVILND